MRENFLYSKKFCFIYLTLLFFSSITLGTLNNNQPIEFHPDEQSKALQIDTENWNFYHPQLMINATRLALFILDAGQIGTKTRTRTPQYIVQTGRAVNTLFYALTSCLTAMGFWLLRGWFWGVTTGLMTSVCPAFILRAHYMKEDPAMLFGIGTIWLGFASMTRIRTYWAAGLIGLGIGLAAGGKYIAVIVGAMSIAALFFHPGLPKLRHRFLTAVIALAVACIVWLGVNFEIFRHMDIFIHGFENEYIHASNGHTGLYPPWYKFYFFTVILEESGYFALFMTLIGYCWAIYHRKRLHYAEYLMLAWPCAFYVILMFSKIGFPRYVLPTTIGLYVVAGWTLAELGMWSYRKRHPLIRGGVVAALGGLLLLEAGYQVATMYQSMTHDSRFRMKEFLRTLDPGSHVLVESFTCYTPQEGEKHGLHIDTAACALESDDIVRLQSKGYTHIAVCSSMYARYFVTGLHDVAGMERHNTMIRSRYRNLFHTYTPIWDSGAAFERWHPLNPQILIYDLNQ